MPTVTIVPTSLEDLKRKIMKVKNYAEWRNSIGFPLYQTDEEWTYSTQPGRDEGDVCPYCLDHASTPVYNGYDLQAMFPSRKRIVDNGGLQVVWPNVHEEHPDAKGVCHCALTWLHPMETVAERAKRDIEELISNG